MISTAVDPFTISITRNNIGPLTTIFTPQPDCGICFVGPTAQVHNLCDAFSTDCQGSPRSCLPRSSQWSNWAFYSPGLLCPEGWTTATVVSSDMTDSVRALDIISLLTSDETAAFCCPTGFTFSYPIIVPSFATAPPRCMSGMFEGGFVYRTCLLSAVPTPKPTTAAVGTGKHLSDNDTLYQSRDIRRRWNNLHVISQKKKQ
ncbi:uncharacterized protein B0T15DRAFT_401777 [Chaetomium strumarium]|uniref:Uncharacterized protein n=1 Tax=Chaetomium strumarium TaxID=1170767 RepID=A0AAJ0GPQ6_9PEZI|nr:hypothetical protein B0T15DRAFT_401777 [Chaetomium strumarium]